jgi:aminobenzoyl-glutamate utilization protein B
MTDYSKVADEVNVIEKTIWDLSSTIWELAEVGYHEYKSSSYASELLEKEGFSISGRGVGGLDTSWIASWGSGSPTVGILVEFDALPGLGNDMQPTQMPAKSGNPNGHGCGHNLICSTSIGAAITLKNYMAKEKIAGSLKVFGCPAKELLNGKNYMASSGAFKGIDVCLHNHPAVSSVPASIPCHHLNLFHGCGSPPIPFHTSLSTLSGTFTRRHPLISSLSGTVSRLMLE